MHTQTVLSYTDAVRVVTAIRAELEQRGLGAVIAVVDEHGELLAFLRLDGAPLPSIQIAINKAYTAARERIPSKQLGQASRDEGFPMTNFGELRYVGWGGGVPLMHEGKVIGAVGVSGLSEDIDIDLAQIGAAAL